MPVVVSDCASWPGRAAVGAPDEEVETIAISEFKQRGLELIERVASGRVSRLVLTRRGRPVAAVVPVRERQEPVKLWGALRELMEPVAGVDLTARAGEPWAAERG
jgi:prevent-host-death family protein